MRCKGVLLIFLTSITGSTLAQPALGLKYMHGFLLAHTPSMARMVAPAKGVELSWSNTLDSHSAAWRLLGDPRVGLAVNALDMGSEINGHAFGAFAFCESGLLNRPHFSWKLRFAAGVGYMDKQFNIYTNPMNRAIGSAGNGFMQLLSYANWDLGRRGGLEAGFGMSHFSNGNLGMPNLGVNIPMLILGYRQRIGNSGGMQVTRELPPRLGWQFSLRYGMREIGIDAPQKFHIWMGDVTLHYPQSPIARWRGGVNFFYDPTYLFEKFQPMREASLPRVMEVAVFGGHEYRVGNVGFVTDFGIYLYRPDATKRRYYEGIGVKYYLGDLVLISRLKAHLTSADYFEWGLGYTLFSKKEVKPGFKNGWKWVFNGFRTGHM